MENLKGKNIVVTGASRGIGFECAKKLSEEGAHVALIARGVDGLTKAINEIGNNSFYIECDVSDSISISNAVSIIKNTFKGSPDVLINNAGLFKLGKVSDMKASTFSDVINVNLVSPFLFVRAFVADMIEIESGHIITVGSEADHRVFPENGAYSASKYGARALHEVMLLELKGTGVRTTLVSPGPTNTSLWDDINPDNKEGFLHRDVMLSPTATAEAIYYAVSQPRNVNIDEIRLSSC